MEGCVGQQSTEHGHLLPPAGLEAAGRAFSIRRAGGSPRWFPAVVDQVCRNIPEVVVLAQCGILLAGAHLLPAPSVLGKNPPRAFPGSAAVQREGAGLQFSPLLKPGSGKGCTKKGNCGIGMGCCAQQMPCAMLGGDLVSRAASCLLSELPAMCEAGENMGEEAAQKKGAAQTLLEQRLWSCGGGGGGREGNSSSSRLCK